MGIHNSPSSSLPVQPSDEQPLSITTVNHTLSDTPSQPSDFLSKSQIKGLKLTRKIKKRVVDETSSASSSSSIQRGIRIPNKRKNPRLSVRRSATDVEAIAFPLGMSIAAVLTQVMPEDYLFGRRPPFPLINKHIKIIVGEPIEFDLPRLRKIALLESHNESEPRLGWPRIAPHGLDEVARRYLYSNISEKIQTVLESLRQYGNSISKQRD